MKTEDEIIGGEGVSDENAESEELDNESTHNAIDDGDQSDSKEEADTSTNDSEESEPGEGEKSGEEAADTSEKKGGVQKRFDKLTAEKYELQKERDYWKTLAQEKVDAGEEPNPPMPPDPSLQFDKPEAYREQVQEYNQNLHKYNKDLLAWNQKQSQADSQTKETEETNTALDQQWSNRVSAFKTENTDFDALVGREDNPVSESMFEIAKRSDMGPQVLYELAKNPAEAMRIYRMSPIQTAHEMGKIEARLAVKPKKSTAAPDPIETVTGSGESAVKSDEDLSMEEYAKKFWKEQAAKY